MYLKQLELQGFKSFAEKVELEFTPGITVFVGPNGSGKSNIVDSIRWVLGEQSAKSLRGLKMDDIIFAGSTSRKPVGMAQVSFTFDNSTGLLPLDFQEITVTRRLYRSGESEYLINKVPCRLKDIHELFMDTGVGREGFSIIGQGKIDEILSLKAEDRRNLIEEAAGIVKYRYRKREAQKKLADTEQSLVRLKDIIMELNDQLGPLEEQSKKAQQYNVWKEELNKWDLSILVQNIEENKNQEERFKQLSENLEDRLSEKNALYHNVEAKIENLRLEAQKNDQKVSTLQQDFYNSNSRLEKMEYEVEIAQQRKESFREQILSLQEEIKNLKQEKETLNTNIKENKRHLQKTEENYNNFSFQLKEIEDKINKSKNELALKQQLLEEYKNNIFTFLQENSHTTNQINRIENAIDFNLKQIKQQVEKKELLDNKINKLIIEEKNIKEKQEINCHNKEKLEKDLKNYQNMMHNINKQIEELNTRQEEEELLFQQTNSRRQIMEEMEAGKEGYGQGVKYVLDSKIPGIIGTVADIIQVPKSLELAIETALGVSLQHIITDNDRSAQRAIEYLKREKKGRATFLPLNMVKGKKVSSPFHNKEVLGRAVELVNFDSKFTELMEFILGRILIVQDLASAVELSKKNKLFRIVTLEGDLIASSGALTGGSYRKKRTSLLGRRRLIKELTKKSSEIQEILLKFNEKIKKLLRKKDELVSIIENTKEQIRDYAFGQKESNNYLENIKENIKQLTLEKEMSIVESEKIQKENDLLLKEKEKYLCLINELKGQQNSAKNEMENLEKKVAVLTIEYESFLDRMNEEKVKLATLKQSKILEEQRLQELEEQLLNLEKNQQRKLGEINKLEGDVSCLDKQIIEGVEFRKQLALHIKKITEELEKLKIIRVEKESLLEKYEQERKKEKDILAQLNNQKHQNDMKLAKIEIEVKNGINKLVEVFNLSFKEALASRVIIQSKKEVLNRITELKENIADLGLVNFTAINEFKKVKERLDFLDKQYTDLVEAKEGLTKVIKEMDSVMVQRFKETFAAVNQAFKEVFHELFKGGNAYLQLSDESDLLNTGVEIIAQPPGKKPQSLSLLSGGERAMTAIALLLGILKVKPSPFCVLDEIDSALDEANIIRFAQYLKQFCQNTQFIVISHRKGTMEVADVLYGVTIQETGISKLLSVKLSDLAEAN